jgi:hypothetical protein
MSTLGKRKAPATDPASPRTRRMREGFDSTPYKKFSSRASIQSKDAVTPRRQDSLKNLMKEELGSVIFESGSVVEDIFGPADEELVENVLGTLENVGLGPENGLLRYPDETGMSRTFPDSAAERMFYVPWTSLLNAIIRITEATLYLPLPFYTNLFFTVYDREMGDSNMKSHPVKPDLIGLVAVTPRERLEYRRGNPHRKQKVQVEKIVGYWWMVRIACEVKADWADMIAQMATYAQCMLASVPSRRYALLIAFNHKTMESRICFFHRGGLMATPAAKLLTYDGFRMFVRHVVQIATCADAVRAGIDDTRDTFHYNLPHIGLRSIEHVLCDRGGLTGRGTRVSELGDAVPIRYNPPNTPGYVEPKTGHRLGRCSSIIDDEAYRNDAMAEKIRVDFQLAHGPAIKVEDLRVPPDIEALQRIDPKRVKCAVIKESFIPHDRPTEEEVFESVRGLFGIPVIVCSYKVEGWGSIYCADATAWNVFGTPPSGSGSEQDMRSFVRTLYETRGYPLFFARGPRQLLGGILHAMIGECIASHIVLQTNFSQL